MTNTLSTDALIAMAREGIVSQASLANAHYQALDLSNVRFESIDARNTVFEDCQFSQSSWYTARLDNAQFHRCTLLESTFSECSGTGLQVTHSNLSDSWWQDNSFIQSDFASSCLDNIAASSCRLSGVRLPSQLQKAWFSMCTLSNMRADATLHWHQVHILESEVRDWSLSHASLTQCSFIRCDMDGLQAVALHGPFLTLWKCSLRDADFSQAMLEGANFEEATLTHSRFHHSTLIRARFVQAETRGASFIHANLSQADASYLQAYDADFSGSQLDLTNVHGAQLDQARWDGCNKNHLRTTDPVRLQAEHWQPTVS